MTPPELLNSKKKSMDCTLLQGSKDSKRACMDFMCTPMAIVDVMMPFALGTILILLANLMEVLQKLNAMPGILAILLLMKTGLLFMRASIRLRHLMGHIR